MNRKQEAANDLMNYSRRKESLMNISEQMAALKAQFGAIRSASNDSTPVMGGGEVAMKTGCSITSLSASGLALHIKLLKGWSM